MTCSKRIAITLTSFGKSAHATIFTQALKAFPSSGQDLMRIRLMAHIPDDLILRQLKR